MQTNTQVQSAPEADKVAKATISKKTIFAVVGVATSFVLGSVAMASIPKQPLSPQAQVGYDNSLAVEKATKEAHNKSILALCESEKTLALAKLKDFYDDHIKLDAEKAKELVDKSNKNCQGF